MSLTEALVRANVLKTSLLDHGVRAVSIELQTGRPGTPNDLWWDDRFVAVLMHHTVSRPAQGDTPCLWLIKNGRADVPGPLCNGYLGYDAVPRIICMGWANHPGEGGPWTVPSGTIPRDVGRPYLFGWECEGGLEAWTDAMHEAMARTAAGTLDWLGLTVASQGEHRTWADLKQPGRKIDRLNYTTQSGRDMTARFWGDEGDDMYDENDRAQLAITRSKAEAAYNMALAARDAARASGTQRFLIAGSTAQYVTVPGGRAWISGEDLVNLGYGALPLRIVQPGHFLESLATVGPTPPV